MICLLVKRFVRSGARREIQSSSSWSKIRAMTIQTKPATEEWAQKRWRCQECYHISTSDELLSAPNPFEPESEVTGCPRCKSIDSFADVCDEPGCDQWASCGWNSRHGVYRRTCGNHCDR